VVHTAVGARKRVFLVSGSTLFGRGLENLLREEPRLDLVGCESDVQLAIQRIIELRLDAVIFDEDGPDGRLREVLTSILGRRPGTRVIGASTCTKAASVFIVASAR